MKKAILILIAGLLLSSNAYAGNYAKFLKKYEKRGSYVVMAKSISKVRCGGLQDHHLMMMLRI
jgi:hypothetical protein